jgi:rod shape determining protein RodA
MRKFLGLDFWLFIPALTVYTLGISILLSIAPNLFFNQLIYGVAAFIVFFVFSQIDYRIFPGFNKIIYIICVIFLILTYVLGQSTRGSVRWIDVGGFIRLQPSELIKPFLIMFVASFFLKKSQSFPRFIIWTILYFIPLIMVLKQPDLGNAIVYFSFWIVIIFISGFKVWLVPIIICLTVLFIPLFWRFLKDYQKERIVSFLNPQSDPLGIGYNAIQAMVAVGSGGFWGLGLGRGTQSHLLFLPEYHTDFIFASFSEEFGFIGVLLLIFLYCLILTRIIVIGINSQDKFGLLVSGGIFGVLFTQFFINVGMNIGLLPITGITLPLVSYGGSSLLSFAILLGIASNIAKNRKKDDLLTIR